MHTLVSLLSIFGALFLGAISPGPSFVFVTRTAVATSRRAALAAACGMAVGASLICLMALLGLRVVLEQAHGIYLAFKVLGGAYLCYLAWRVWRGSGEPVDPQAHLEAAAPRGTATRSFWLALATQLSNPKTLLLIGSIFAALLPAQIPGWMYAVIPGIQLVVEGLWYAFVALAMSSSGPRGVYLRAKKAIDRVAGCVIGVIGLRLLFEGAREAP